MLVNIGDTELSIRLHDWSECDCCCEAKRKLKIIKPIYDLLVKKSKEEPKYSCIE